MTELDRQCKVLKRKLKEWEASFFKEHGRKATVEDIAQNPTIGTDRTYCHVDLFRHITNSS
jgi:hypothetical protein